MKQALGLTLCLAFFTGCLGTDGSNNAATDMPPYLEIECSPAQATDCVTGKSGRSFWAGFTDDLSTDCSTVVPSATQSSLNSYFTGHATMNSSFSSGFLIGTALSWRNSANNIINTLPAKTYKVCAFLDTDGSGRLNAGEPLGEGELKGGAVVSVVDDWFDL